MNVILSFLSVTVHTAVYTEAAQRSCSAAARRNRDERWKIRRLSFRTLSWIRERQGGRERKGEGKGAEGEIERKGRESKIERNKNGERQTQ